MNITEHEMRGLLTGKCIPGDMLVNEELPAYLVRKFAELKAQRDALADKLAQSEDRSIGIDSERMSYIEKCNALAAENALLKSYIDDECYIANPEGMDYIGAYSSSVKNSATAAYLKSVRAEGVEMFAAHHGTVADFANGDNQQSHRITEIRAKHFAAQLRAGEPS